MGNTCVDTRSNEKKISDQFDIQGKMDYFAEQEKIKLLLLGAGESGKSTIFKQMKVLYGVSYTKDDMLNYIPQIYQNTISSMKTLLDYTEGEVECKEEFAIIHGEDDANFGIPDDSILTAEIAEVISTLWKDKQVQEAFADRSQFQLNDSAQYFIERRIKATSVKSPRDDVPLTALHYCHINEKAIKGEGKKTDSEKSIYQVGDKVITKIRGSELEGTVMKIAKEKKLDAKLDDPPDFFYDLHFDGDCKYKVGDHVSAPPAGVIKNKNGETVREYKWTENFPAVITKVEGDTCAVKFDEYEPTLSDVMRVRIRTSGIVEEVYNIRGVTFVMFDVGGQRNERKKWIHCFEDVTAVIFVAAISEYDQALFEDNSVNRITEALNLFHEITHLNWFVETPFILFLNKIDLFEEKIKHIDPGEWFPSYTGGCNYDKAAEFFKQRFLSKLPHNEKECYTHFVCAVDTNNVHKMFSACSEIIIGQGLREQY